jgi:hypothetical protein
MSQLSRTDFEALWLRLDEEAQAAKFSHGATMRLTEYYKTLAPQDRLVVDDTLVSWVGGGDSRRRFDALALIDEFEIRSALPALETELERLSHATGPSVPTDRAKLERLIARLQR